MGSFRTPQMIQAYADYRAQGGLDNGCRLCEAPSLKEFTHWKICEPKFPFDQIARVHHMLLPIRHTTDLELTHEEIEELTKIKHSDEMLDSYEFTIEATHKKKSIPGHFHLHLLVAKD